MACTGMGWSILTGRAAAEVIYAFRGSTPGEGQHRFVLQGVRAERQYHLHFEDGSSPDASVSGRELLDRGVTVALPTPLSSELVFLEEAR